MHTIEFRVIPYETGWGAWGPDELQVIDIAVDGTRLLDLVREAELPFAEEEQQERAAEFAPDPAPLLAGDYMCLPARYGWPCRHLLGDPEDVPWCLRQPGETMLLTCTCGIDECWALMASVEVTDTVVVWSYFRNTHRDWWGLSTLGRSPSRGCSTSERSDMLDPPAAAPDWPIVPRTASTSSQAAQAAQHDPGVRAGPRPRPRRSPMRTDAVYVALGDSISIDAYAGGPGRGAASLLFRNRDDDFPAWRERDLHYHFPDMELHLLARDAATSHHVMAEQLPQVERLARPPALATITMGGNDLLAAYGHDEHAVTARQRLLGRGAALLSRLRTLMDPQAPIVLGTIYDPSDGSGDTAAFDLPPWPEAVAHIRACNEGLRDLACAHDVLVADLHDRFMGHGIEAGDPGQLAAQPINRALWYCLVVEPNAWGASEVRAAFWDQLSQAGFV
jgi:lysophospholipase L1-like esterase